MSTPSLRPRSLVFAVCLAVLLFSGQAVLAGTVTITLNNASFAVVEGDTLTLDFTITNGSGTSISTGGYTSFPVGILYGAPSGDISDVNALLNAPISVLSSCAGLGPATSLAPGASCDESVPLLTLSGLGETDGDFGVIPAQLKLSYLTCIDSSCVSLNEPPITALSASFEITVNDPPVRQIPTPEPASLLLLGSGILALRPLVRRRRAGSSTGA